MSGKLLLIITFLIALSFPIVHFGQAPDLGAGTSFALFTAAGAFNNIGATSVIGDIGTNVGAFTGFPPGTDAGQIHVADAVSAQVATDIGVAYGYLASQICGQVIGTTLGNNQVLTPNIYCLGAASTLNGNLTLNGQGNPNSIFIFKIDGALSTGTFATVTLINSASLCNVYWQVNGAFSLGDNSTFRGTLLINGAITLLSGSTLYGRALSTSGAVSTFTNNVFISPCGFTSPPNITCPPAVSVTCSSQVPPPDITAVQAALTCPSSVTVVFNGDVISSQTCTNHYTLTRSYKVTDGCGNSATCAQIITVNDQIAPAITCPGAVIVSCANLVPVSNPASTTTSDNCGGTVTASFGGDIISNQTCANAYSIRRTYQASDACGNTATCTQAITVSDVIPPTISCPAPVTVSCASQVPATNPAGTTTSDNCGAPGLATFAGDVISNQTCPNKYIVTRTYHVTDLCGNSANCTQLITVSDQTAPGITCPAGVTVSCATNVPTAVSVTASDNCGGAFTVFPSADVISNQTCANRYSIARTYLATDLCGNSAVCTQTIVVNDLTPPAITCPASTTVSCAANVPVPTAVTASDNCGGTIPVIASGDVISNQTCANRYTLTRTYQATDLCGNSAVCTQTIVVNDLTPPAITCPASTTVSCAANVPTSTPVTASDNCGGTIPVIASGDVISNQTCANRYTITRTYQATDLCGNSAICTQTIIVSDQTPPPIVCPANVTVTCAGDVPVPAPGSINVADNCGGVVSVVFVSNFITNQTCPNRFTINRTYQATDVCGNSSSCIQIIAVNDLVPPPIVCPPNVTVTCAGNVPAPVTITASDNCGGAVTVTQSPDMISNQTCANRYTLIRTYQATDLCGNSTICSQTITVNDQTPPSLTCPANVTVSCAGNVPVPAAITASDNCSGSVPTVTSSDVISNQTCANRYTITRTYLATDLCGNSANCAQIITVIDQTPPTIVCPVSVTVSCAGNVPVAVPGALSPADNCGGAVTVTQSGDVITNQTCANRYTITRTYQATDLCGNGAVCVQTIIVNDQVAPTIICPVNVTVACASLVPVATPGTLVTSDNCGGTPITAVLVGDLISNQTCANIYTLTRTYRATDLCGNSTTCAQIISVLDNTAPVFLNPPANVTADCSMVPDVPVLSATDNCAGGLTVLYLGQTQVPGVCPVLYTLTRTWVATDLCGNSATVSQKVTVQDLLAPQFNLPPADVVLQCNVATNLNDYQIWLNNHGNATAFDCSAITWSFINSPLITYPTNCANTFQHYIRFIATDACGNSSFEDALFTVVDETPPVFTVPPQNIEIECAVGSNGEVQLLDWIEHFGYAKVSDNCGAVVTQIVFLSEKQNCGNTFTKTYQFRATDGCGNTNYVQGTFSVVDHTPPAIECPKGNVFLTCEFDVPPPNPAGVLTSDNCGGPVTITWSTHSTGVGCLYWPKSVAYWYMATDACGNMSNCDQSFIVIDSIPPVYAGPDTIKVNCVDDLPASGDLTKLLRPYMVDNCYDIICIGICVCPPQGDTNTVTYKVNTKDLCGNWASQFMVTFIVNGVCKPICTAPQTIWGDPQGTINGINAKTAVGSLISLNGKLTAGHSGKSISVGNADCLQSMLPSTGGTGQFSPGDYPFNAAADCQSPSPVLNTDGSLKNKLAANVLAMQLNIWYNHQYNSRNLGVQRLSKLPVCLIDPIVFTKIDPSQATVQGLLNLSNDYLDGVGAFPPQFGILLSAGLDNLNNYWQNCLINNPCQILVPLNYHPGNNITNMNLAPNPAVDLVTLSFEMETDAELQVRFIGSNGAESAFSIQAVKGYNSLECSLKTFPTGIYTVILQHDHSIQTLRIVKMSN